MHFSSRQLLRLFLKPKYAVSRSFLGKVGCQLTGLSCVLDVMVHLEQAVSCLLPLIRKIRIADHPGLDTNEEVDETFWARAAAERAEGGEGLADLGK